MIVSRFVNTCDFNLMTFKGNDEFGLKVKFVIRLVLFETTEMFVSELSPFFLSCSYFVAVLCFRTKLVWAES